MASTVFLLASKHSAIEFANVEVVYVPEDFMSPEKLQNAKMEIFLHIIQLTQHLAVELSFSLKTPVSVQDIELEDGSVIARFAIYIGDKLLVPALAGYLAAVAAQPNPPEPPPLR